MPALPAAERARLEAAYRATTYRIHAPQGDIDLRIGGASPALDALLREEGIYCWAIITAWNPGSKLLDAAANAAAQARLQEWLSGKGYRWLPGENLADVGGWVAEPTTLVFGMVAADARSCGWHFGQVAVVTGAVQMAPQIVWCDGI
ncbi:MAG: DUF3293 domain-containing protein [Rhodocyclaceae bacterium]|nr:DUF3293 domain-containing protein [Rhodocyclaceae bacterium]